MNWSGNSRANLDYDTIKSFKDNGYESGSDETLARIKKGVTTDETQKFTKDFAVNLCDLASFALALSGTSFEERFKKFKFAVPL